MENFITHIQIYSQNKFGKVLASVKVKTSIGITLTNLQIVIGPHGLFVAYPPNPYYNGDAIRAIFYPENKQVRDYIEKAIIEKYENLQ